MNKNLGWKLGLIIGTLVVFLAGIFGLPKSFSGQGLKQAVQDRIHLGLDLKGGTHLILQVQVNDAINADTDRTVERLKDSLKAANVAYGDISKPDPQNHPEVIDIKGVPATATADLRRTVTDKIGSDYELNSGAQDVWTVSMKPSTALDIKKKAVQQAIETIRNRI